MRTRSITSIALAGALAFALAACGDDSPGTAEEPAAAAEPAPAEEPAAEPGTIVDVAAEAGSFTTLLAAAQAAGLVETLSGDDKLTVFAPTDEAFAAALDALGLTAEELLADTDTLTSILTYHVVAGEVPASAVLELDGQKVATVNGAELSISIDDGMVMVDDATVVTPDVQASNGIIHVIDSVLIPAG